MISNWSHPLCTACQIHLFQDFCNMHNSIVGVTQWLIVILWLLGFENVDLFATEFLSHFIAM